VSKPLRDPSTMMRLQTAATNIVQTAASRSQDHSCLGSLPDASLNIIGCARLVSLVGPVVFIRCWFKIKRANDRESNGPGPTGGSSPERDSGLSY
jgi:hypothetical protein